MIIPVGTEIINILAINTGSSSIKLAFYSYDTHGTKLSLEIDATVSGIGHDSATLAIKQAGYSRQSENIGKQDHLSAMNLLIDRTDDMVKLDNISAIGHRIVHGGPHYNQSEIIDDKLITELNNLAAIDPEHMPFALKIINGFRQRLPNALQVACFDTAYFHNLPEIAQLLTVPRKFQAHRLRRYGFHGLSYSFLQSEFTKIAGQDAANGRVIYAHLGSGVSLAATKGGKPVDTTMSFSPNSGVMMSTRSGDIDPNLASYISSEFGLSSDEVSRVMNFESGLLGVSGTTPDMYKLLQTEATDKHAQNAVNLFVHQVKKAIGALATTVGGMDSLIFSGGIGAQAPKIRQRICNGLEFLGVELDDNHNQQSKFLISSTSSRVGVHVLTTNEEQIIADEVIKKINAQKERGK